MICKSQDIIDRFLGFPVFFSSGRAALRVATEVFIEGKVQTVWPYASQCVVLALAEAGVIPVSAIDSALGTKEVVYHQWGYQSSLQQGTPPIIEDNVHSLFRPGTDLFGMGGLISIWSLPKVSSLPYGAIAWCKDMTIACQLQKALDEQAAVDPQLRAVLRDRVTAGDSHLHEIWQHLELISGEISSRQFLDIENLLCTWHEHFEEKLEESSYRHKSLQDLGVLSPFDAFDSCTEEGIIPRYLMINEGDGERASAEVEDLRIQYRHLVKETSCHCWMVKRVAIAESYNN